VASVDGWRDIIIAQRGWPLEEPRPLSKLHDEHEAILRAVRDRDPYTAAQAMHHHLVQTGTNAMKELSYARTRRQALTIPPGTTASPNLTAATPRAQGRQVS
jgi:hypothetical protein